MIYLATATGMMTALLVAFLVMGFVMIMAHLLGSGEPTEVEE